MTDNTTIYTDEYGTKYTLNKDADGKEYRSEIDDIVVTAPSDSGFSIARFKSEMNKRGFLRSNRGQLIFNSPKALDADYGNIEKYLIRAHSLQMPAVAFTKDEGHKRYGYGPSKKNPGVPVFAPINIEFIVDKNGEIPKFFYDWMMAIIPFDSSQGMKSKASNGSLPYEHSYRKEYVTDLHVSVYDETTRRVLEYKMAEAWPSDIHENRLSWGERDDIIKQIVTFQYTDWVLISSDSVDSIFNGRKYDLQELEFFKSPSKNLGFANEFMEVANSARSTLSHLGIRI